MLRQMLTPCVVVATLVVFAGVLFKLCYDKRNDDRDEMQFPNSVVKSAELKREKVDESDTYFLDAALKAVREKCGDADYDAEVLNKDEDGVVVTVWRIPRAPGGFCDVKLSNQGEVIRLTPGS